MKKLLSFLLIMALLLATTNTTTVQAATKINKKSLTLEIGDTYTLKITGTNTSAKWSSFDTDVATVSKTGKVNCIGIGYTIIKATVKRKTYSCKLHVNPVDKNISLHEDDSVKLTYVNTVDGIVYFNVFNKTSEPFSIADEYFILDGTTYPASGYCSDVPPNYIKMYEYETDLDLSEVNKITGSFKVFGNDGITIEMLEFRDIDVK